MKLLFTGGGSVPSLKVFGALAEYSFFLKTIATKHFENDCEQETKYCKGFAERFSKDSRMLHGATVQEESQVIHNWLRFEFVGVTNWLGHSTTGCV